MTSFNLQLTVFHFIYRTQYHMEYIDILKQETNPFVSTLPFITFRSNSFWFPAGFL